MSVTPVRASRAAPLIALVALVALTFGAAVTGGFVWDDHTLIAQNLYVHGLRWVPRLLRTSFWDTSSLGVEAVAVQYYRPVVSVAYALVWSVARGAPVVYHLVNLALHLANTWLGLRWLRARVPTAPPEALALSAVLLAVHPTRVESVAWISGSPDLYATLFMLLAATARRPWQTALAAVLAAGSKESAVALPALLALDAWALSDDAADRAARRRHAGAALLGVGAVFAARSVLVPLTGSVAAVAMGPSQHAARVLASFGLLLARLPRPSPLGFSFAELPLDVRGLPVLPPWSIALGAAATLAVVALAVGAWRRPTLRAWAADAAWVVLPMAPALNFLPRQMPDLVSDRMLYTSMLGVAALTVRTLALVAPRHPRAARSAAFAAAALLALGAVSAARYAACFRSDRALWLHEAAAFPDRPRALLAVAQWDVAEGRVAQALPRIARGLAAATRAHSRDGQIDLTLLAARALLAVTPDHDQETLLRVRAFLDALVDPARPRASLDARGMHLWLQMRPGEPEILARQPTSWRLPRALLALRTLDPEDAARRFGALVRELPTEADAQVGFARSLAVLGRWDEATLAAARAAGLSPAGRRVSAALRAGACAEARARPADATVAARCWLNLGLYEYARRTALTLGRPAPTPALVEVMLDADLAERLWPRAWARLERDGARFPDHAAAWRARVVAASAR